MHAVIDAIDKPPLTRAEQKTAYSDNKLEKRLCREAGRAIGDFNKISSSP